ncbi:MAG: hypothetical protein IPJ48_16305 [Propionivibrio sp.]|uniref:Tip attachment protein J domain-containing protein n=1 Tax=Candidatus Propionivibrio dominans TaxID=2954373 RepID=A0A9D7FDR8_9RHOO|nr:hypothetical protein [Candidatus Propionivibrio dominans]
MSKTVGQWVGTVVGAVIGFYTGGTSYIALGAAVGGAVGAAVDPPKGPNIVGPRLSDLGVQTASYGSTIPRLYGTCAVYGTVVWIENNQLRETKSTTKSGGKGGGGGGNTTTYSYSATIAIVLCQGPIAGVRRIWAGSKLIYDAGDSSATGMIASSAAISGITIYTGDDTQMPNDRMQMTLGAGNVSAWRGIAYAVIEDFQLADYGNSLLGCPFKFEVMSDATFSQYSQQGYYPTGVFPQFSDYLMCLGRVESGVMKFDHSGLTYSVTSDGVLISTNASNAGTFSSFGHVGMLGTQSVDYVGTYTGDLYVGGVALMHHYSTSATLPAGVWHMMGACVDKAGTRLYVLAHRQSDATNWLQTYDSSLNLLTQGSQSVYPFVTNAGSYPLIPGNDEVFTVEEGGDFLWKANSYAVNVTLYPIVAGVVGSTLHSFTNPFMGPYGSRMTIAAENQMLWGAHDGGGIFLFSRASTGAPSLVPLADVISAECLTTGYLSAGDIDVTTITDDVRGYRITNNAAVRAALEALQAPYPFDVIQDGYKIKFVKRGGGSVATIVYEDMGTTAGNKTDEPRLTVVREMDAQLPRRIEISYFDADREYDTGEQADERLNSTGTSLIRVEVPVVMTANEAAGAASTLLYLYHLERLDLSLSIPTRDPYNKLQPADPIFVVTPDATYFCRITSLTHESDRVIKLTARLAAVALYSPTAVGGVPNVQGPSVSLSGPSIMAIMDIPTVSGNDTPGLVIAARGAYSGWRGAEALRSDDGGVSWTSQVGIPPPGATVALANNTIGSGPTNAMDVKNVLNVSMVNGDISSVTELALFNGANLFAYGEPGRWEIIGARTVTLQGDGTYNLTNLLRGRYGTEWAMTSHAVYDDVILLDGSLAFTAQPTATLGAAREWTVLGNGDSDVSQNQQTFTYAGENLECLSPVHVSAIQAASGDWAISWVRRTRINGEWLDYVDVSLGETAESYVIDIYDDSAYTTIIRTITASTQTATYNLAQQTIDWGSGVSDIYFRVSQVSDLVGTGRSLDSEGTSAFSWGDPTWANTVALLHMNDTGLTDVTGKTVTVGSAARSSAQSKFGGYSALFGASGTPLDMPDSSDFAFSTDFCIECFIYPTTSTGTLVIAAKRSASTFCPFYFALNAGNLYGIFSLTGAGWDASLTGATTVPLNQWSHVALTRLSGTVTLWLDGVSDATVGLSGALMTNASPVYIGGEYDGTKGLNGYLDEVRIKKGVAVYSGTFTPPTAPFPNF